jgi:N-acetyl-gamma-glutamyl-phosphate reductase
MIDHATRAAVLGATGYAGRELVGLLGRHPRVRLAVATSESEAGGSLRRIAASAPDLTLVRAEDADLSGCEVVFSCLPHGEGGDRVCAARDAGARVVDLSADLRVAGPDRPAWAGTAVYGLPELFRAELSGAALVANPGCYPTAVLVALAPLLRRRLVSGAVVVNAASGVTGAGRSPRRDLLFGEVAENYRAYGVGNRHRHLPEMRAHGARLSDRPPDLVFTPHLLPVRRGILATMYVPLTEPVPEAEARELWEADYAGEPFVDVLPSGVPSLASAVATNRVVIGVSGVSGVPSPALQVVSAIDNLLKGAAGQAVQNMNLAFGWPETEGLPC